MAVALILVLVAVGSVLFHLMSPWWFSPLASNWRYMDDTIVITFWITGVVYVAIILFMAYCVLRFLTARVQEAAYNPENKKLEWWLTHRHRHRRGGHAGPGLVVWNQFHYGPERRDHHRGPWSAVDVELPPPREGRRARHVGITKHQLRQPARANAERSSWRRRHRHRRASLHLPIGKPVKLSLRSIDVLHDFFVPEFRAKMDGCRE